MKVRKAIQKMIALGTGLTMVGATLFGAAAADLSHYPNPMFIDNGVFDGRLVVGDNAASSDVIGAVDVSTSLQFASTRAVTGGSGGTVTVSGDSAFFGGGSDLLELNETLGDVKETFTEDNLMALKGGRITTSQGATDYNQYMKFPTANFENGSMQYGENEYDEVGVWLFWDDGAVIYTHQLEFEEGLESDVESGTRDATDLEDENVVYIGQQYSIVDTDVNTAADSMSLTLMSGEVATTMEEGETQTFTVDGVDHEVTALIICDTCNDGEGSVKFKIDGQTTKELEDGDTDLINGLQVGIRDILPNEASEVTGGDLVEAYFGANKVELEDTNYSDNAYSSNVEINNENIEDAAVKIKASELSSGTEIEIASIFYQLTADAKKGDVYVPPESEMAGGLRSMLDEPEGMMHDQWDIEFYGFTDVMTAMFEFDASGDDQYDLEFTTREGKEYKIPLLNNEGTNFKFGDDDDTLIYIEATSATNFNIMEDAMFVLTDWGSATDNNAFTHVMRFDSIDTSNRQLRFSDLAGGTKDVVYDAGTLTGNLIMGGHTYMVSVNTTAKTLAIDQNGDGSWGSGAVPFITETGATLMIQDGDNSAAGEGEVNVTLTALAKDFDERTTNEVVTVGIQARTNNEVGLDIYNVYSGMNDLPENDEIEKGMSLFGALFERHDPSGGDEAEDLKVEWPETQRGGQVAVTAGVVTSTMTSGGAVEIVPINVGAAKLASEIADLAAMNTIIVGGPCANSAAAEVLGNPEQCWTAIPENKAIIKVVEHANGNVALLVAGRTAMDTRRACRVLANWADFDLSGMEVQVSGTSLTDISVSAPSASEEEA